MEVLGLQSTTSLRCLLSLQASASRTRIRQHNFGCGIDSCGYGTSILSSSSVWKLEKDGSGQLRSVRRASSGGTRRDQQKITARTQKRRARHVKGVTPTKDDLLNRLAQEVESDELLEQYDPEADLYEDVGIEGDEDTSSGVEDGQTEAPVTAEQSGSEETADSKSTPADGDTSSGVEEIVENDNNTFTVRFIPQGGKESSTQQANGSSSGVQEAASQLGDAASQVADAAQEAVSAPSELVGRNVQEAGDRSRENVQEGLNQAGSVVEEGLDRAGSVAEDVGSSAQETAQDVAATVQSTAEESADSLNEAGAAVREGIADVAAEGRDLAREAADVAGERVQDLQRDAEKNFEEVRVQGERGLEKAGEVVEEVATEAGKSAEVIGDSLRTQVSDVGDTLSTIAREGARLGEVATDSIREAAGVDNGNGRTVQVQKAANEVDVADRRVINREVKLGQREDDGPYTGLNVAVAGATGRTGRLVVEELVRRGAGVTALVRDSGKARDLARLSNVQVTKVNLYSYESVKNAIEGSNVVICAVGATGLPFDPIGTYQVEYEGVKNLVAAAKNGGKAKKFVLISTIGVSFLQIIPLIFWKKQAELYLQRSGLDYTIIRPGGLKNGYEKNETVLTKSADSQFGGSITRRKVAELCVDAIVTPEASEKIVEVIAGGRGGETPSQLFGRI